MPAGTKAAMESSNKRSSVDALLNNVNEFIQSIYNDVGLLSPVTSAATASSSTSRTRAGHPQHNEPWRSTTASTLDTSTSELESSPNASGELDTRLVISPQRRRNVDAEIERINRICDNVTHNLRSIGLDVNLNRRDQAAASTDSGFIRPSVPLSPDNVATFVDLSETQMETPQPLRPIRRRNRQGLNLSSEQDDDDVVVVASNLPPVIDLCTPGYEVALPRRSSARRSRLSRRTLNHSTEEEESVAEVPVRRRRRVTNDNVIPAVEITEPRAEIHNQSHNTSSESVGDGGNGGGGGGLTCPICMDSCLRRRPTSTKCGHVFCETCIRRAIQMTHKCPMCNKKILERQLIRLYP